MSGYLTVWAVCAAAALVAALCLLLAPRVEDEYAGSREEAPRPTTLGA